MTQCHKQFTLIIIQKLTWGFGVLTEALCTRECMVAHQLAVPRTAVAEVNIYVEMWGSVFYSGVAALINFV